MSSISEPSQFFGIHAEANQRLRLSSRIANRKAREAEQEAWSTCGEPSPPASSHTDPVLRHANFRCDGTLCKHCSLAIDQCVEMLCQFHTSVDDALKLPGGQCKDEIRWILQANNEWIHGLKRQQNREG
ncbi:hypothetical protein N7453_007311 [Penicillium expansum]|nr:hypothetical protein N7453_007311 [Penicillium expansum]